MSGKSGLKTDADKIVSPKMNKLLNMFENNDNSFTTNITNKRKPPHVGVPSKLVNPFLSGSDIKSKTEQESKSISKSNSVNSLKKDNYISEDDDFEDARSTDTGMEPEEKDVTESVEKKSIDNQQQDTVKTPLEEETKEEEEEEAFGFENELDQNEYSFLANTPVINLDTPALNSENTVEVQSHREANSEKETREYGLVSGEQTKKSSIGENNIGLAFHSNKNVRISPIPSSYFNNAKEEDNTDDFDFLETKNEKNESSIRSLGTDLDEKIDIPDETLQKQQSEVGEYEQEDDFNFNSNFNFDGTSEKDHLPASIQHSDAIKNYVDKAENENESLNNFETEVDSDENEKVEHRDTESNEYSAENSFRKTNFESEDMVEGISNELSIEKSDLIQNITNTKNNKLAHHIIIPDDKPYFDLEPNRKTGSCNEISHGISDSNNDTIDISPESASAIHDDAKEESGNFEEAHANQSVDNESRNTKNDVLENEEQQQLHDHDNEGVTESTETQLEHGVHYAECSEEKRVSKYSKANIEEEVVQNEKLQEKEGELEKGDLEEEHELEDERDIEDKGKSEDGTGLEEEGELENEDDPEDEGELENEGEPEDGSEPDEKIKYSIADTEGKPDFVSNLIESQNGPEENEKPESDMENDSGNEVIDNLKVGEEHKKVKSIASNTTNAISEKSVQQAVTDSSNKSIESSYKKEETVEQKNFKESHVATGDYNRESDNSTHVISEKISVHSTKELRDQLDVQDESEKASNYSPKELSSYIDVESGECTSQIERNFTQKNQYLETDDNMDEMAPDLELKEEDSVHDNQVEEAQSSCEYGSNGKNEESFNENDDFVHFEKSDRECASKSNEVYENKLENVQQSSHINSFPDITENSPDKAKKMVDGVVEDTDSMDEPEEKFINYVIQDEQVSLHKDQDNHCIPFDNEKLNEYVSTASTHNSTRDQETTKNLLGSTGNKHDDEDIMSSKKIETLVHGFNEIPQELKSEGDRKDIATANSELDISPEDIKEIDQFSTDSYNLQFGEEKVLENEESVRDNADIPSDQMKEDFNSDQIYPYKEKDMESSLSENIKVITENTGVDNVNTKSTEVATDKPTQKLNSWVSPLVRQQEDIILKPETSKSLSDIKTNANPFISSEYADDSFDSEVSSINSSSSISEPVLTQFKLGNRRSNVEKYSGTEKKYNQSIGARQSPLFSPKFGKPVSVSNAKKRVTPVGSPSLRSPQFNNKSIISPFIERSPAISGTQAVKDDKVTSPSLSISDNKNPYDNLSPMNGVNAAEWKSITTNHEPKSLDEASTSSKSRLPSNIEIIPYSPTESSFMPLSPTTRENKVEQIRDLYSKNSRAIVAESSLPAPYLSISKFSKSPKHDPTKNVVFGICLCDFNHSRGPEIEYWIDEDNEYDIIANPSDREILANKWPVLPFQALPDGSHEFEETFSYFNILYDEKNKSTINSICDVGTNKHLDDYDVSDTKYDITNLNRMIRNNTEKDDISSDLISCNENVITLWAISCVRQIASDKLQNKSADVTRTAVQKGIVIICRQPIFGQLKEKLSIITKSLFLQQDFTDKSLLKILFDNLRNLYAVDIKSMKSKREENLKNSARNDNVNDAIESNLKEQDFYVGLCLKELMHKFKRNALVIFKSILLEKKILFFSKNIENLCLSQFSFISLIPNLISNLDDSGSPYLNFDELNLTKSLNLKTSNRYSFLDFLGLPLLPFGFGGVFNPYTPLQQLDDLLKKKKINHYTIGTSNDLLLGQKEKYCDVLINLDTTTVEIINKELAPALTLSHADKKFIDLIVKNVDRFHFHSNDPNNAEDGDTEYNGSDDYIRVLFEEYLLSLLSASKYDKFLKKLGVKPVNHDSHNESPIKSINNDNSKMILDDVDMNNIDNFNLDFISDWLNTSNYSAFDSFTDNEIFYVFNPKHVSLTESFFEAKENFDKNYGTNNLLDGLNFLRANVQNRLQNTSLMARSTGSETSRPPSGIIEGPSSSMTDASSSQSTSKRNSTINQPENPRKFASLESGSFSLEDLNILNSINDEIEMINPLKTGENKDNTDNSKKSSNNGWMSSWSSWVKR